MNPPLTPMSWLHAARLAASWSFGIVLTTTVIAGAIDMDGRRPDFEWFFGLIVPVTVVLGATAHLTHRSARITGLILPLVIGFGVLFLAAFVFLDLMRMGA